MSGTQGWRDMSKADRQAYVAKQARDSNGRWIEMGKPVKYYSKSSGGMKSGLIVGTSGSHAFIIPPLSNATQAPTPHRVPLSAVQMIGAKGRLPRVTSVAGAYARVKQNMEAAAKKRSEDLSKENTERAKKAADERTERLRREAREAGDKRSRELKEQAQKRSDARNLRREKEREARQDQRTREREARQDQRQKEREARQDQRTREREARQDQRQKEREAKQARDQAQREQKREQEQAQREQKRKQEQAQKEATRKKEQAEREAQRKREQEQRDKDRKAKQQEDRNKREQERRNPTTTSARGNYNPSNSDIERYVSRGISRMLDSMSESEQNEFRDFLNTIRDLISNNPTPTPTKKYSENDHSKSPERPSVREAVSDFFDAISEYFDGKRSDFKDIKYTTLKDTDKHDLKSSVRLGENGPEVVLRDQDGKLVTTVPVAQDDDPDRVTDLLMDHYDYKESE